MNSFLIFLRKVTPARSRSLLLLLTFLVLGNVSRAQYCSTPILDCTDDDMVLSLTFASVTNVPVCNGNTGYRNYTTSVATRTLAAGSTNLLSATVGYADDEVGIWIDYNHNNTFDPSEFTYIGYAISSGDVLTANVTVPITAMTGNTRMRLITYWYYNYIGLFDTDGCLPDAFDYEFGDVNDYTVNITPPPPPSCLTLPTAPANAAATVCAGNTVLSWPAAPGASGYDVYLNAGTGTPTTIVSTNQATTSYTATTVTGPYVWKVIPKNVSGAATGCATWTFTTITPVVPAVSIVAAPGNSICTGTSVTYTATVTNGGASPSYQWKRNATNAGTNASTFTPATVATGDKVSVVLTSNATCAIPATAASDTITMTVVPHPTASITAPITSVCQGSTIAMQANTGTALTYQWLLNNSIIPGATADNYAAAASGDYRVAVSNGVCADTADVISAEVKPLPILTTTLSGPTTFCSNSSLTINSYYDPSYTYQWANGSGNITGATSSSYTTTTANTYTVTATSNGCTATSTPVTTAVLAAPSASITAGGPVSFCLPGSVILSANTGSGLTYSWQRNGVAIAPAATGSTYTANVSGSYTVIVSNTNCSAVSNAIAVTASTLPPATVTVTGSTTFCQGSSVQLRATQVLGYTYQWYRNGLAITVNGNTFAYTATTAGAYNVVITNGACVTTTGVTNVTVNPLPVATATALGATAFCQGGSVSIAANTGTGLTYQWRRAGTPIVGETGATTTASIGGFYQVVVSNGICTATSPGVNVVVSTMPNTSVTALGSTTFCQNGSVDLEAAFGAGYIYQWQKDGIDVFGATSATYTPNTSGSYAVEITNGTCVGTSTAQLVSVTPGPATAITAMGPLSFCQGGGVELKSTTGVDYQYQWILDGVPMPGKNTSSIIANTTGNYTVHVSDGVCDSTSAVAVVTVNAIPVVVITVNSGNELATSATYASYQWYRNGSAIAGATASTYTAIQNGFYSVVITDNVGCSATSSVQSITSLDINSTTKSESIKIYPNPAQDLVQIEASGVVDVTLSTVDGRILIKKQQATNLDLTPYANGVYLIRIDDHKSGALIKTDKLVKGIK